MIYTEDGERIYRNMTPQIAYMRKVCKFGTANKDEKICKWLEAYLSTSYRFTTVVATDPDTGAPLTYSVQPGVAGKFKVECFVPLKSDKKFAHHTNTFLVRIALYYIWAGEDTRKTVTYLRISTYKFKRFVRHWSFYGGDKFWAV